MNGPTTNEADIREAAAIRKGGGGEGSAGSLLDLVKAVGGAAIVPQGVGKYVLVQVEDDKNNIAHLVRMDPDASYHKDAARPLVAQLRQLGASYQVLGGGRINHAGNDMLIYGHSYGFPWRGPAQHETSAAVVRQHLSSVNVSTSNEGY